MLLVKTVKASILDDMPFSGVVTNNLITTILQMTNKAKYYSSF
jgi:hypothetical protein